MALKAAAAMVIGTKYTDESVVGLGVIKGADCQIESIVTDQYGDDTVTFVWTGTDGQKLRQSMLVKDGTKITSTHKVDDEHFVLDYSDGTTSEPIEIPSSNKSVVISPDEGNAIQKKTDGLYVEEVEYETDDIDYANEWN